MKAGAGRSSVAYRRSCEILRREAPPICSICGQYIDRSLHHTDRMSWTAEHVIPLRDCERLGVDPDDLANLRPAHRSCNSAGGANYTNEKKRMIRVSRSW